MSLLLVLAVVDGNERDQRVRDALRNARVDASLSSKCAASHTATSEHCLDDASLQCDRDG